MFSVNAIKPMKQHHIALSSLWMAITLPASAALFPNGDFETPGGASWTEASGGGTYTFDYPTTGGKEGGFGIINHSPATGGFGIWVGNNETPLTLSSLGLEAGKSYNFTMDMKRLSGSNIGGFKLDFTNGGAAAGSTNDIRIDLIGDGSTWETYTYPITIPAGADGFKVVPLWGIDSSVGYDNIGFDPTPIIQDPIINPGFSDGSLGWSQVGSAETTWSYPTTGGNPDNYGVMTNTGIGFGIWIANGDQVISLESLGLEAGTTVNFLQDMKIFSGTNIGGLKIDFFTAGAMTGSTGDVFGTPIEGGTTWQTYTFPVALPAGIDGIKIVPLWGAGSSVGYDNIRFIIPPVIPPAAAGSNEPVFAKGSLVQWTPTNPEKIHQPQSSQDGNTWSNFGPAYPGIETTSILDPNDAPFYRVIAQDPPGDNSLVNGGFEVASTIVANCAEGWACLSTSGQFPTRITTDSFSGTSSMRIAVQNNAGGSPNQAEIQQNLGNAGGFVTGGQSYTFSFQAKQISSGVSYVQQYRLQWYDDNNVAIPGADIGFTGFSGGNGSWAKIEVPATAPANAAGAFIQIFGATGAEAGTEAKGEVLIDDISLSVGTQSAPVVLQATATNGVGVYMLTETGKSYKAQVSDDLQVFTDLSDTFPGNGQPAGAGTAPDQASRFYRFLLIEDGQ